MVISDLYIGQKVKIFANRIVEDQTKVDGMLEGVIIGLFVDAPGEIELRGGLVIVEVQYEGIFYTRYAKLKDIRI